MTETLEEYLAVAHDRSMDHKAQRVLDGGRDAPMPFVVTGNRGTQYVASFFPANRDELLWTVRLALGAFGCDRVAGTMDAFMTTAEGDRSRSMMNPDIGRPFEQGDMQRAWNAKRPWVTEALMTNAVDKVEQRILTRNTPYRVKQRRVRYGETMSTDMLAGLVPDALREALAAPDMMATMRSVLGEPIENVFSLTPLEQRAHVDVVAIRWCAAQEIPVVYGVDDPDVRGIIEMSLTDERRNAEMGVPGLRVENIIRGL